MGGWGRQGWERGLLGFVAETRWVLVCHSRRWETLEENQIVAPDLGWSVVPPGHSCGGGLQADTDLQLREEVGIGNVNL